MEGLRTHPTRPDGTGKSFIGSEGTGRGCILTFVYLPQYPTVHRSLPQVCSPSSPSRRLQSAVFSVEALEQIIVKTRRATYLSDV